MLPIPSDTVALLFDCDGTLADTMTLHYEAWHETLLPHGVDCPRALIDDNAGVPTTTIVAEVNRLYGKTLDAQLITHEKETRFHERIHLARPVEEVLATAHAYFDKLPMAVVSGGTREMVHAILKCIDAESLFPVVITADDPVAPKPSPDVFVEAARRLEVAPEKCHVFEDGDPGIVAAKAAGMTFTDVRVVLKAKTG
ncbi:HAD family hydrolase [Bythopirellula polymerisocia]|uniref:Fructose-1-phosphate phosphatase YqaB n=1 Tax=Bythopirellula polymerisocia TaxID=2528003 RepID=A0A5C6D4C2_9BACT|nr:HAD family phosphatase [Bythopirellula polymerisocia]TWU29699.1 Fructose-1-phosphate phosphatase YqaB [Bythopirellula polymerisocia]